MAEEAILVGLRTSFNVRSPTRVYAIHTHFQVLLVLFYHFTLCSACFISVFDLSLQYCYHFLLFRPQYFFYCM